MIFSDFILL